MIHSDWRLWNPGDTCDTWDDDLYRDLGLADHDTPATDPTIMEHLSPPQAHKHVENETSPVDLNINSRPKRVVKRNKLFDHEDTTPKKTKMLYNQSMLILQALLL